MSIRNDLLERLKCIHRDIQDSARSITMMLSTIHEESEVSKTKPVNVEKVRKINLNAAKVYDKEKTNELRCVNEYVCTLKRKSVVNDAIDCNSQRDRIKRKFNAI